MKRVLFTLLTLCGVRAGVGQTPAVPGPPLAKPAATPLEWEHDWKSACERAVAAKKPILVFVLADSEPVCAKLVDHVAADVTARRKLESFVLVVSSPSEHATIDKEVGGAKVRTCARYDGITCAEHQALERTLRDRFLDPATESVVVPTFGVFDAKGDLVLKRSYAMKREGFLEFLAGALAAAGDPAALRPAGHAPSPEVERIVAAILDAKGEAERTRAARELFADVSPERESALRAVLARLKSPADQGTVIRAAGAPERKAWAPAFAPLLAEKDRHVRNCAVVTLEEQRNPAVAGDLLAAWAGEKDVEIRKDLLRALGPCGAGNAEARKLLLQELATGKEQNRVAAAVALGALLADDAGIAAALEARFPKETSRAVRVAIVWGVSEAEDPAQVGLLDRIMKGQRDEDLVELAAVARTRLQSNLKKAVKSLGKGGGPALRRLVAPIYERDQVVRNVFREADEAAGKH